MSETRCIPVMHLSRRGMLAEPFQLQSAPHHAGRIARDHEYRLPDIQKDFLEVVVSSTKS